MPWSRWHWLIVISLGATWIFDGLEVTLAGSLGGILTRRETLGLTDTEVGATATFYLSGAVIGALLFGYGTDRFGLKFTSNSSTNSARAFSRSTAPSSTS